MEIITIEWYNSYETGYNSTLGGEGSRGRVFSDETKRRLSEAAKGRKHSDETKRKMSEAHRGENCSKETRRKLSEANLGKKHTDESKAKMSEYQKGKKPSEEVKRKMSNAKSGDKSSTAKLTWTYVREIRSKYIPRKYSLSKLSKEYNVSSGAIYDIIHNITWIE